MKSHQFKALDTFLPFSVHLPVLPVQRPGRRSRSARCCSVWRAVPRTWRHRWAALAAAGVWRRQRLLSAGYWRLRFRAVELPLGHLSTTGHTQTLTETHARTQLLGCVKCRKRCSTRDTHSLRKWSRSYDRRGGGVKAQNTVFHPNLHYF